MINSFPTTGDREWDMRVLVVAHRLICLRSQVRRELGIVCPQCGMGYNWYCMWCHIRL